MNELADSFEADGFTADQLKALTSRGRLTLVKAFLEGRAEIKMTEPKVKEKKVITSVALNLVTSDGIAGSDGIKDLEKARYNVGDWAKDVMKQKVYVVSNGVAYKPVVLKGEDFTDGERVTSNIRKVAEEMGLITPPAELARLLRKSVSDEEIAAMGLWWLIVMHEPITDSGGGPDLLGLGRGGGGRGLDACDGCSDSRWDRESGFVFLAPQVSA
jgi:hypothetical protein